MADIPSNTFSLLGSEMATITKLYYGAVDKRLPGLEIDRFFGMIFFLGKSDRNYTQQDLAKEFRIDKTVLTRIIDYLSDKNFVARVPNPDDKRSYFIQLTPLARQRLPQIRQAFAEVDRISLHGFNREESETFQRLLIKVKVNLFQEPSIDFQLDYNRNNP